MTKEKTNERPRSKALAAVHETAAGLHRLKIIDAQTMREFDAMCLTPVKKLTPDEIRALREREAVSQPVFAHYLNVSKSIVSKWERGDKKPDGASLKLAQSRANEGTEGDRLNEAGDQAAWLLSVVPLQTEALPFFQFP